MNKSGFYWWSILLFVFFIPLAQNISAGLLISIFIFSLFIRNSLKIASYLAQAWDVWLYLLMLLLGMLYTQDKPTGLKVLETSLTLLVLPPVMLKIRLFDKQRLLNIFYSFCIGLMIACLICISYAAIRYFGGEGLEVFSPDELTGVLFNTHPIYFAYYLIFAITFGLYLIYYKETTIPSAVIIALLIFFFIMLLLMGSSTAVLSVVFSFLYFILKFYFETDRSSAKKIAFGWALFFLLCLFIVSWMDFTVYGLHQDVYWERFVLWESALNALPNWLIGVGTGDYTLVLNHYYLNHGLSQFAESNFNPHNQFIDVLFCTGLAGLITLLLMMCRPMYESIRNQSIIGFLTIFPFLVYGITEVFLGRYQGVVFFALLHQTFTLFYRKQESSVLVKDN